MLPGFSPPTITNLNDALKSNLYDKLIVQSKFTDNLFYFTRNTFSQGFSCIGELG